MLIGLSYLVNLPLEPIPFAMYAFLESEFFCSRFYPSVIIKFSRRSPKYTLINLKRVRVLISWEKATSIPELSKANIVAPIDIISEAKPITLPKNPTASPVD